MRECLPIQIGPWIPLIRAYLYLGRLVLHLLSLPGLLVAYLGAGGGGSTCLLISPLVSQVPVLSGELFPIRIEIITYLIRR